MTADKYMKNEMVALCREVDLNTGKIAVYEIESPVTDLLIRNLTLRSRFNPGVLRYFITMRVRWEGVWKKDIMTVLKRKNCSPESIERLGGLVEL